MLVFSLISALFSPSTNEEIVVKENTVLFIDDLNIIGDRDTKPEELNFDFEVPLPIPILENNKLNCRYLDEKLLTIVGSVSFIGPTSTYCHIIVLLYA